MAKRDLIQHYWSRPRMQSQTDCALKQYYSTEITPKKNRSDKCAHKTLATFCEPSTMQWGPAESAMYVDLEAMWLGFSDANSSSASKGETVSDTTRVMECFLLPDIIAKWGILRRSQFSAANSCDKKLVINAGDGGHLHPSQTLTDLLTILWTKDLTDLKVGFLADLKFGRTEAAHEKLNPKTRCA